MGAPDQDNVREEPDRVMPRHDSVKVEGVVCRIEEAVLDAPHFEIRALLRPVAEHLAVHQTRDARQRELDLRLRTAGSGRVAVEKALLLWGCRGEAGGVSSV